MSTLDAAIQDARRILNSGGFEQIFTLTSPDGLTTGTVKGIEATIHVGINAEGVPVNSKNTRISLHESDLIAAGIPTRNTSGDLNMMNYIVEYTDRFGKDLTRIVQEQVPDDTLGVCTFWIGEFKK